MEKHRFISFYLVSGEVFYLFLVGDICLCSSIVDFTLNSSIVGDVFLQTALERGNFITNSFGGYKLSMGEMMVDVWPLEKTWGIIRQCQKPSIENLVKSAFFNFSAVAYSLDNEEFYIHKAFDDFLLSRVIDVVFEENPSVPLCILNSLYYSRLLKMPLSCKLHNWISFHYDSHYDFRGIQLKHWGRELYSMDEIEQFANSHSKEEEFLAFKDKEQPSTALQLCLF